MATILKCDRCDRDSATPGVIVQRRNIGLISYSAGKLTTDAVVDLCGECSRVIGGAVALAMISSKVGE